MWAQASKITIFAALTFGAGMQFANAQVGTPPAQAGQRGAGTGELSTQRATSSKASNGAKVEPTGSGNQDNTKAPGKLQNDTSQDSNQKPQ